MSRLQELIAKLCPDGVPYRPLGEVCEIRGRIGFRGYTRKDIVSKGNGAVSLSPPNIIDGVESTRKKSTSTHLPNDFSQMLANFAFAVGLYKIAAVREQYEYYRNRLLTFKKIS